jgi:hypothetical protein
MNTIIKIDLVAKSGAKFTIKINEGSFSAIRDGKQCDMTHELVAISETRHYATHGNRAEVARNFAETLAEKLKDGYCQI